MKRSLVCILLTGGFMLPALYAQAVPTPSKVPLHAAIKEVVHPGWVFIIPDKTKAQTMVTFPSEESYWRHAVDKAASEAGCRAEFFDKRKCVHILTLELKKKSPAAEASKKAPESTPPTASAPPSVPELKQATPPVQTQEQVKTFPPVPEVLHWNLHEGSLRHQLQSWAKKAGYQVIWNTSSDLEMQAFTEFSGSFAEAVTQLFDGLRREGFPFYVTLYSNKVLEVTE